MPWGPLIAGCCAGVCVSAALARLARTLPDPSALASGARLAFVPVVAGVAFLLHDPHGQLTRVLPARAWLTSAVRLALALPVLAGAWWAQLSLDGAALTTYLHQAGQRPALPWLGLTAELAAGCALALAAAALVGRGRWQDLGGAVAAPAALAALAVLVLVPLHLLPAALAGMSVAQHHAWIAAGRRWGVVAVAAAALACWASRDPWRRLSRRRVTTGPGDRGAG
jgi:hypothetical protein